MSSLSNSREMAAALMQIHFCYQLSPVQAATLYGRQSIKGISHRIEASGWVEGRARGAELHDTSQNMQIWQVQCFVLLRRCETPDSALLRFAFVKHSPDWLRDDLGGGLCYKAPSTGKGRNLHKQVQVVQFDAPCMLVRASQTPGSNLRLVPLHGK
jgi:hypothetical protein